MGHKESNQTNNECFCGKIRKKSIFLLEKQVSYLMLSICSADDLIYYLNKIGDLLLISFDSGTVANSKHIWVQHKKTSLPGL